MTRRSLRPAPARALLALGMASVLVACAGPQPTASPEPSLGPRPSSPAQVEIVQPATNTTVTGTNGSSGLQVHVVLKLTGATIVPATTTTTTIRPDQGHVHLYVNNVLVSMNYGLEQDIVVKPGTIALKAEFVAADHAPFSPRVWSPEVIFTVHA